MDETHLLKIQDMSILDVFGSNRVDNNEVKVEYLPTHIMLADYFTKPLQGEQFKVLRGFIMGWRPMSELIIMKDDKKEM